MSGRYTQLFQDMFELKERIAALNKKYEKYRTAVVREMDKKDVDVLKSEDYVVKRSMVETRRISKKKVPKDVWQKYSTPSTSTFIRIGRR